MRFAAARQTREDQWPGSCVISAQKVNTANASALWSGAWFGGVSAFCGGLPLYESAGKLVEAFGVSGDSSCADHNVAPCLAYRSS